MFLINNPLYFWGLLYDVFLALLAVGLVWFLTNVQQRLHWTLKIGLGYVALLFYPNAWYLAIEGRRLLDGTVQYVDWISALAYLTASVVGLVCAIAANLLVIQGFKALRRHKVWAAGTLAFLATWGTALGMVRLNSIDGLTNPLTILTATWIVVASSAWTLFLILSFLFLTLVTLWTDWVWIKR